FIFRSASSTISAIGAREPSTNQWNMLMPVREYNKHMAKIPNCKMRLRATTRRLLLPLQLLLLLQIVQALEPAAGSGAVVGGGPGSGGGAPSTGGGATGGPMGGGPGGGTLIANLTEQGSPGVYNSTMG
ncbi:hypothetical protein KR009_004852, partial [Drosophila setifemur]